MNDSGSQSTSTVSIYPELAEAIRGSTQRIIYQWQSVARQSFQEQDDFTCREFEEKLPYLLEQLAKALETHNELCSPATLSVNYETYRFSSQLDMPGLFVGYDMLRAVLTDELAREIHRGLNTEETLAVCTGIELAVRAHLLAFIEHQRREFQAVSQARSMYLSFMAHDLRSGLNSVVMLTELLGQQLAGEPRFESTISDLHTIQSNIQDTVVAMNRFMKGEQLRNKKLVVSKVSVDIRALIQKVVTQYRPEALAKGLDLVSKAPENAVTETDRELVFLILQNLVSNAVKYTNRGTIEIEAFPEPNSWKLAVSDQGPGISQNRLDKIFEPFTRGETHGQPGAGLGLSIAQHAAEALEAKLWAESQIGQGTTFYLQLPI